MKRNPIRSMDDEDDNYGSIGLVGENSYTEYTMGPPEKVDKPPFGFARAYAEHIAAQQTKPKRRTPMTKTTLSALVLKSLGKRGKTAADIAAKLDANPRSVSTALAALVREGQAQIVGTKTLNNTGRPSNLYAINT